MFPGPCTRAIVLVTYVVLCPAAVVAQARSTWIDPPRSELLTSEADPLSRSETVEQQLSEDGITHNSDETRADTDISELAGTRRVITTPTYTVIAGVSSNGREKAARDLAYTYLSVWSAPNRVALAAAPSFYGATVKFHRQTRTIGSILAEKRRFAERWPDRNYRYRPESTRVSCAHGETQCTVRSAFDFFASNPRRRQHSRGVGEHELVVSFSGSRPVIAVEDSRVLRRGEYRLR